MNKIIFSLITIFFLSFSFVVSAETTNSSGSILDTLIPSKKNCNYISDKQYEPFSGITNNFPGAQTFMEKGKGGVDCVKVEGGTENLLKLLFTTAITIIIVMTVISISIAGIQFMTEQATGQIKGGAKKRLQNSFIALALGLLSYTILYTVNKQLVNFTFNPASIDVYNAVDRGIADANEAAKNSAAVTALIDAARPTVTTPYGIPNPSPTGWINPQTNLPCTPTVAQTGQAGPPNPLATTTTPCVKQNSLAGAYANGGLGFGGAGTPQAPGTDIQAKFTNINNPTLVRASADGILTLNGVNYNFRSGGGGNGYLPVGTYTVTNGYLRGDSSMSVDGYGYSFDLTDAFDPRTNATRSLLRIHPDGGYPGTLGCIGIQGPLATQQQFYNSLKALLAANGGKYTIRVGM